MRLIHSVATTLLLMICLTGCKMIYDDQSKCPPKENVTLGFRYIPVGGSTDNFLQKVQSVTLTVFDDAGCFVMSKSISQADLTAFQGTNLKLDPGTYRVVCWGNATSLSQINAFVPGSTTCLASYLKNSLSDVGVTPNGDCLYYGPRIANLSNPDASIFNITVPAQGQVVKTMDFTGAHKTIEVYVKGFSDTYLGVPTILPTIETTSVNQGYNFSMQTLAPVMKYSQRAQITTYNAEQIAAARFDVPLFDANTSYVMNVKDLSSNQVVASVNLKDFIANNSIPLTAGDHDLVQVYVEFKGVNVTISLPAWGNTGVKPSF